MEQVVLQLLKELGIAVSGSYCKKLILSHPDYPSLLSVGDAFERLGIPYSSARISKDDLPDLSFPYLLQIDKGPGEFILIRNQQDLTRHKEDLSFWNGIVLAAEAPEKIRDGQHSETRSRELFLKLVVVALIAGLVLLLAPAALMASWVSGLLLVTAVAGAIVGYLLVAKDLGVTYKAVEDFCNSGKSTNCDKILKSDNATLIGMVKFSDAVVTYFAFQLLFVGLSVRLGSEPSAWAVLSLYSAVTLPIIVFSLYYQKIIAKAWCILCLAVDLVLVVQAALIFYLYRAGMITFTGAALYPAAASAILLLMLGAVVLLVKSIIESRNKLLASEVEALRIVHSESVFMHFLHRQEPIDATSFDHEMVLGKPGTPLRIIMASNAYCRPCKEQHEKIARLIETYPDYVSASVRFLLSGKDVGRQPTSSQYLIHYWLLHIYGRHDESAKTEQLLHDWYEWMDLDVFSKKYPANLEQSGELSKELEAQHFAWCNRENITRTPTLFVNGYQLPEQYTVNNLMAMVPALANALEKSGTEKENALHNA